MRKPGGQLFSCHSSGETSLGKCKFSIGKVICEQGSELRPFFCLAATQRSAAAATMRDGNATPATILFHSFFRHFSSFSSIFSSLLRGKSRETMNREKISVFVHKRSQFSDFVSNFVLVSVKFRDLQYIHFQYFRPFFFFERRSVAAKGVKQRSAVAAENLERRRRRAARPQLRSLGLYQHNEHIKK